MRAVILEQENFRLRFELDRIRNDIERHRIAAFNTSRHPAAKNTVIVNHPTCQPTIGGLGPVTSLALAVAAAVSNGNGKNLVSRS